MRMRKLSLMSALGFVACFLAVETAHAQPPCDQCPTLLSLCGPELPPAPDRPIPPEPSKRVTTKWAGRSTVATGGSDLPLDVAKESARSAARGAGIQVCLERDHGVLDVEASGFAGANCTASSGDGSRYTCSVRVSPACFTVEVNPETEQWRQEKERIEALRRADEIPRLEYAHCVRANRGKVSHCQSTCGTPTPVNPNTPTPAPSQSGQNNNQQHAPQAQPTPSNQPNYYQQQQAQQQLQQQQQQAINAGAQEIGQMVQGMDDESKDALGAALGVILGIGLVGLEIYGLAQGIDLAQIIAGSLVGAGAAGVAVWQIGSAVSEYNPGEGPYGWGGAHWRFALAYERALLNYSELPENRAYLNGVRAGAGMRFGWLRGGLESGLRFGTIRDSTGAEYDHLAMPLVFTWGIQPIHWGHWFSPVVGFQASVYIQSNTPLDGGDDAATSEEIDRRIGVPEDDTSFQWTVGNTISLGRLLGHRESTLYIEPALSVGGMGTSFLVHIGAIREVYMFDNPTVAHQPLPDGQLNTKATLAAALMIDDLGVGTGASLGGCMNFKITPGVHFCFPVHAGLYFDADGNAFVDGHPLGAGFGYFSEDWHVAGFGSVGARMHGSEPVAGAADSADLSVDLGISGSYGFFGGSLQVRPLPQLTTILSAGVAL
jgi:hypothetical protein